VYYFIIVLENGIQCFVCFDEFALDEEVKVLPCKHHYHRDCIVPWLERVSVQIILYFLNSFIIYTKARQTSCIYVQIKYEKLP